MPLELTPLLDLTPLDEESDRGYERPPRGEMLEPEILRPSIGEGPEDIPPGMSAGIAPRPTEAEWEQARKQSRLGEEIAGTMAEGELVGRTARMFEPNLPRNLLAPTTEEAVREGEAFRASIPPELQLPQPSFRPPLSPETRESLAAGEALSGTLADLSSADQAVILGGAALSGGIPGAAGRIIHGAIPATFGVEGLKSIYEGGKTLLSDDATPEERGAAKVQIGMGATMLPGLGALTKRPAIPRPVETIVAKVDAAVPDALSKSKAAALKVAEDVPQQLETAIEKGIPDENDILLPTARTVRAADIVPTQKATEAQGPKDVLNPVEQYVADVGAGKVTRTEAARDFGRTVKTAEEIAQLKEVSRQMNEAGDKALAELPTDATLDQQQAAVDLSGRAQFLNEAIEAATGAYDVKLTDAKKFRELMEAGKPANEKAIPATTEATTTATPNQTPIPARQAPVVEPGVGAVPENLSGAGAEVISPSRETAVPKSPERKLELGTAVPETPSAARAKPELPGTQLGAAESKLAEVVNQTIEAASPTRLGASPAATMRPMDVVLGAPDLRSISPAVEARWQQAVKGTESIIDKVKTQAGEAWKSITREYADLPPREFPAEIDVLRRLRASRNASARTTVDVLKGITNNLGPKQYGVFNRVALLEDLVKDVEAGKYATGNDLPFGYKDAGELTADLNKFRSVAEATPQIKAALERRQEFMDSLRNTLVERGFLPESILEDPRYFHHQVLLYMAEKNAPTGSRSFRDWFSGWQKKRTGSSKDYNRQYVEAEAEVLSDAFNKIAMQDLQGEMRGIADLTAELKELHGAEWRQHIPKTHTLWQPQRGNAFYPVQTVAERVMDRYLSGLGDILPSEFKEALAMGGRKQEWVIPKPLAKVLDNISPRPDNWIGRLATTAQNSWKRYILLNPLRAAKYNLNNLSGDLDFLFAAQPKIFKEFKSSAGDMWGFHVKGKSAVGDIKEAIQDGVIGSGWRASEFPDIARSDYFNWLTGEKPKLVDRYWDWIGKRSDAREDTGRLASYRFAKKEWEAGRPFYGASVPADVNALATPRLKAAKVAREILIDYGRGTEFSNFTRQKLVPFFKWMEGNFVRYQQLIRNVPEHEGAGPRVAGAAGKKTATLGLRIGAAYGIVNLWNHMFFPEEEEELGEGRNQLHLILGRDDQGNIQTVRFQGALSDLLGWVGGEDLPQDVKDVATGKASAGDKMEDAYEAGISRAVNASLPFPKTAAEIGLGRSFYPNALSPRPVRDKAEHAAGLFSLKPVYQWLAGKPHKPLRQEIANLVSYTTDPGEAAYNTTRHMAGEWLEEHGEERANVIPGKRSNALYYYKQALRYKDQEMAKKFLDEYNRLGGKREGLNQSIKASAPLSMLGTKQKAFLDSLSPQEKEAVRRAEEWYRRVYARPPTPNPNP